jgi:PAS domain S-box-containing protein
MKNLRQSDNELFRNLFDVAPDPILIIDRGGTIVRANKETERCFGYAPDELLGQKVEVLVPTRYRGNHVKYREEYSRAPILRPMGTGRELFALRKDGSEFPVEISLSPMKAGDEPLVIGIIRDITDRKQVERELKYINSELGRSNKELEEFAYIASHDLQEPLRSVAGACQLLKRRYSDKLDASAQEFIDFAVNGAKRMEELINDLLAYSRVSTKAKEPASTDLNKVMAEVLDNLKSAVDETKSVITVQKLPTIPVDQWQILQLFQNLIANSLKFRGNEAPKIEIGATEEGDKWHFTVKDNGIGIDPKYFDRIFVVFKRLHTRTEYPGTGIGLASCKKIVERHGGTIWAESTLGLGTTFHFTLAIRQGSYRNEV